MPPRRTEPTSPITMTLPTAHLELLRAESLELYGTTDRYASIIRSDVRASLAERGKLPDERPRPKPQRCFVERWTMPPIAPVANTPCIAKHGEGLCPSCGWNVGGAR